MRNLFVRNKSLPSICQSKFALTSDSGKQDTTSGLKLLSVILLGVNDFAEIRHLFLCSHAARPFVFVSFDMEICRSKNTFITISITMSDRPKSTALN